MQKMIKNLLRKNVWLRQKLRDTKMYFLHKRYDLSNVDITFYFSKPFDISRDLKTGKYCYMGPGCWICPNVTFGNYVMFGPEVSILGGDHVTNIPGTPIIFSGRPDTPKTVIEDDVWVGFRSQIMAGVRIGKGAVVAAGSIVTKDVEPFSIVGGVPAQFIKNRFYSQSDVETHFEMLKKPPHCQGYAMEKDSFIS